MSIRTGPCLCCLDTFHFFFHHHGSSATRKSSVEWSPPHFCHILKNLHSPLTSFPNTVEKCYCQKNIPCTVYPEHVLYSHIPLFLFRVGREVSAGNTVRSFGIRIKWFLAENILLSSTEQHISPLGKSLFLVGIILCACCHLSEHGGRPVNMEHFPRKRNQT